MNYINENSLNELDGYLSAFAYAKYISIFELWAEIDRIWDACGLDNKKRLADQDIGSFYSHPVWVLNGLFAETDPTSLGHRKAIASYINRNSDNKGGLLSIADLGGGSGVLAEVISKEVDKLASVDIIEPWPFDFFISRHAKNEKIRIRHDFSENGYDIVIAQTVLEHVDDPLEVAIRCIAATRVNGLVIFGNDFHPVIKCHLPPTFYLRHTFRYVITSQALMYLGTIPGCTYAQVFRKVSEVDEGIVRGRARIARLVGPLLNLFGKGKGHLGGVLRKVGLR